MLANIRFTQDYPFNCFKYFLKTSQYTNITMYLSMARHSKAADKLWNHAQDQGAAIKTGSRNLESGTMLKTYRKDIH